MSDANITVGSAQVDLGTAFQDHARARIRETARKYLGDLTLASVHVAHEGTMYRCTVLMQMGGLSPVTGEATAPDVPLAFKAAHEKVAKQLRRTKRLVREAKPRNPDRVATA